jgi:hypothetical protein
MTVLVAACGSDAASTSTPTSVSTASGGGSAAPLVKKLAANGLPSCMAPGSAIQGSPFPVRDNPILQVPKAQQATISVAPIAADLRVGQNTIAIGIADQNNQPISGAQLRMTLYDVTSSNTPRAFCQVEPTVSGPGTERVTQHVHADGAVHQHGGTDDRVGYYAQVTFDKATPYGLAVEAIKDGKSLFGTLQIPAVNAKPILPEPGDRAFASDNLTKKDVANIAEIDSGVPPNDMHDIKIKDAIAAGRPLVIVFATPAYCQTAFCGPVTEEMDLLHDKYRDRVDFVHIEIWRDHDKGIINPTALEWLSQPNGDIQEPAVYVVGKDGVIVDHFEGPIAGNIVEPVVQAVAAGKTFSNR